MQLHRPSFQLVGNHRPVAWVARQEIEHFTGGFVPSRYTHNLDAKSKCPAGCIRVGRKIAYPVGEVVRWFEELSEGVG